MPSRVMMQVLGHDAVTGGRCNATGQREGSGETEGHDARGSGSMLEHQVGSEAEVVSGSGH